MAFHYTHTLRFRETDAAGVAYFAHLLAICHDAYEASLAAAEVDVREFFGDRELAVPITSAHIDFFKPVFCGDGLLVRLAPTPIDGDSFEIDYQLFALGTQDDGKPLARARTRHVCIDPQRRQRRPRSPALDRWLSCWRAENPESGPSS